jgi:hypothetical protein
MDASRHRSVGTLRGYARSRDLQGPCWRRAFVTLCPARGRTTTSPFTRHLNRSAEGLCCEPRPRARQAAGDASSASEKCGKTGSPRPAINCTVMAASIRPGTVEPTGIVASNPRNSMTMPNERCRKVAYPRDQQGRCASRRCKVRLCRGPQPCDRVPLRRRCGSSACPNSPRSRCDCPSKARPCCVEENKMSYHIEINEYQRRR